MMVNIVKYKLDIIRIQIETEEKQCSTRAAFRCLQCKRAYSDLDMRDIFLTMKCIYCGGQVDEDQTLQTNRHSRNLLVKYNTQMEYIFNILRTIENIRLSNDILNPKPMDMTHIINKQNGCYSKKMEIESIKKWSGDSTRNIDLLKQMKISVNINDELTQRQSVKTAKILDTSDRSLSPNNTLSSLFDYKHDSKADSDMLIDNEALRLNPGDTSKNPSSLEENIMRLLLIHEKKNINGLNGSHMSNHQPFASNGGAFKKRDFIHHISDDDSTAAIIDPMSNEDFFMNELNSNSMKKNTLNGKKTMCDAIVELIKYLI